MSPSFSITLDFKRSKDYQKVVIVLCTLVLYLTYEAHLSQAIKLILFFGVLSSSYPLFKRSPSNAKYLMVSQEGGIFETLKGEVFNFIHFEIRLDNGLFFILYLINYEAVSKRLVIFHDELPQTLYRKLCVLSKIR